LGKLPLVIGMPVMISRNFDVDAGIVNGCIGTLKQIRYTIDNSGRHHAVSCVIDAPFYTGGNLLHLPDNHVAILKDSADVTF
ncbi:hypothetical protein SERLA73DRAFT_38870, partial [Serpula lacrymans var. lacrymans S7.3]